MSSAAALLLAPLTSDQRQVVDLVADAFLQEEYEWPYYDYVERTLDDEGVDAWEVLQSFPQVGRWGYGPVSWVRGSPGMKPSPEVEIALTVVGMSQCHHLEQYVETFFILLEFMALERKATLPSPRLVAETLTSSDAFHTYWRETRRLGPPHPRLTYQLLDREPPGAFGSRSYDPETSRWTRSVPRELLDFTGLKAVEEYLQCLDQWLGIQEAVPAVSAPTIPLPAALDHLDDVWRLAFREHLFELRGAERLASLNEEAASREEYEARLSVLGDLLRSAGATLPHARRRSREHPLASLQAALESKLDEDDQPRAGRAIAVLEAIISIRDSRQHAGASHRSMEASHELGLAYPVTDWSSAWRNVTARAVEALGVIRDELRASLD